MSHLRTRMKIANPIAFHMLMVRAIIRKLVKILHKRDTYSVSIPLLQAALPSVFYNPPELERLHARMRGEQVREFLLHVLELRRDDDLAVALILIPRVIVLVIVLGRVEGRTFLDGGDDRVALAR